VTDLNAPDQFDRASALEQLEREQAMRHRVKTNRPVPNGECHQCGEELDMTTALFCGARCAKRWSFENE